MKGSTRFHLVKLVQELVFLVGLPYDKTPVIRVL